MERVAEGTCRYKILRDGWPFIVFNTTKKHHAENKATSAVGGRAYVFPSARTTHGAETVGERTSVVGMGRESV
jgi:hypothetical protein